MRNRIAPQSPRTLERIHKKSMQLFEECRRYLAAGVASSARVTPEMSPIFFERGKGSRIFDVDGNEYIDYILAWGPLLLGHCPQPVVEAVKKQLDLGTMFGSEVAEEVTLSRMVCDCIPSVELVRFTNSASEAVHMALRLARAYTGKSKIAKFEGAYHGWFDDILISIHPDADRAGLETEPLPVLEMPGQPASVLSDICIVPWNRLEIVENTLAKHSKQIGALIVEPIMCNSGVIPPASGFLEGLREITKKHEVVLIFDETITGFRVGLGGAQAYYKVIPDMTVFGKGLGGGYPIAGFGGKKDIMNLVAQGKVRHQGTYNANPLCVVAALATLRELSKDHGAVYKQITELGKKLMGGIKEIFTENGLPVTPQGPGPLFSALFTDTPVVSYRDTFRLNSQLYSRFWLALLDEGVRIWQSARGLWYLSAAHTEEDIDITLDAITKVAKGLKS